jgi:tetratricopeptide (TPR) repeat protein
MDSAGADTPTLRWTFQDFFLRGVQAFQQKRWRDAVDSLEKALGRVDVDQPDPADVALATADLRESYLEEIRRLVESRRVEEASRLIESALARFPSDAILLLALGEARLNLRDWAGAIEALVMAREIEPNGRVDSLLEKAYLEIAADAARANDVRAQELRLVEGVQRLPSSGPLHFELGKLYARLEAYDDAIAYLHRASELEATLRDAAKGCSRGSMTS